MASGKSVKCVLVGLVDQWSSGPMVQWTNGPPIPVVLLMGPPCSGKTSLLLNFTTREPIEASGSPPSLTTTQASLSKAGRNMNWGKKNDFTNIHTNLYPSDSSTRGQLRVYERRHIKEQTLFLFASLFQISAWISKLWQAGSKFSLKKPQNSLRWSSFLLEPRRIWQMMKKGRQRNGINCAASRLRILISPVPLSTAWLRSILRERKLIIRMSKLI